MTTALLDRMNPLDDDHQMIRDNLRRYVEEKIVPKADAWERDGMIPREAFREIGALGFLGMRHPERFGGGGLGPLASTILGEELARSTFGGVASAMTVHSDMSIHHIAAHGSEEQKQRYLPRACRGEIVGAICVTEPSGGSDVAAMRTSARRDGNGWLLKGGKTYITNGVYGDVYIVAARTDPDAKPSRGISLFIVEKGTQGFDIGTKFEKHGWRASDTAEIFFDDVKLPADAIIGEEGQGFYYIADTFQNERLVAGAMSVGQCTRAIELTTDYVRQREVFGAPLWNNQVVRNKLATMATKTAAARALTYECARLMEAGEDAVREVSMLKVFACETLQEVVYGCLQLHGGLGYIVGTPIERMARDARILTIGGGATEVMLEEVAKRM